MEKKFCKECGKEFTTRHKKASYCSVKCANIVKGRSFQKIVQVCCKECGKVFSVHSCGKYTKTFCNQSCVSKYRMKLPYIQEMIHSQKHSERVSKGIKRFLKENPIRALELSKEASMRMIKNNPSKNPLNIGKAQKTKAERGILHLWTGKRGGNGKLTPAQVLLSECLGWQMEYPISLGKRTREYPTCYKVDVAFPEKKIAIEIDGKGHLMKLNMEKDLKKTQKLKELGWKVLRFTNLEIMTTLSKVLLQIRTEIEGM
jgi:hypothetical protein